MLTHTFVAVEVKRGTRGQTENHKSEVTEVMSVVTGNGSHLFTLKVLQRDEQFVCMGLRIAIQVDIFHNERERELVIVASKWSSALSKEHSSVALLS